MSLTEQEKRSLKKQAHSLKPVVIIGANGLTENVLAEINRALDDHELIKVKIASSNREFRQEATEEICAQLAADEVQRIGMMSIVYRKSKND